MSAQSEVPIGTPLRDAWEQYKLTDAYRSHLRWVATNPAGELWAAFVSGWEAASAPAVKNSEGEG